MSGLTRRALLAGAAATAAAAATAGTAGTAFASRPAVTAIRGVTVVDADGPPRRGQNVLLVDGRILAVGRAAQVPVPRHAEVVDGRGRYLVPGLVDAHVHSSRLERTFPPLYLVNGVTTVREMGADEVVSGWRREVEAGTRLGPRWVIGSLIVDGSPSLWEGIGVPYLKVANRAEAREVVRTQQAAGADFVKTYTRLSRESFHALASEARRRGIPFLGHVPDFVTLTEASSAGLRTVEHLYQSFAATSARSAELRAAVARVPIGPGEYGGWYTKMHPYEYAAARSHSRSRAARVFGRLAENGTWVTPTLTVHRLSDRPDDVDYGDARLAYIPASLRRIWQWSLHEVYMKDRPPSMIAEKRELFERRLPLVASMAAAGVPLVVGSDVGASFLLPGFAVHEELALLAAAGLSTRAALGAATIEAARALGLRRQGLVRRGYAADLVLLDADPVRDVRNTSRIHSVIVRGRVIGPAERQGMLADVKRAAEEEVPTTALSAGCACH